MNKGVLVLMSTYNGEKFLREQIDSISKQKGVDVRLLVRDDGSTDSTLKILAEYKAKGLLDFYTGGNLGPQRSFMHLLQHAPAYEYYAFADQDDVWLEDKLSVAVERLKDKKETPVLYFSQTQLVDEELHPLKNVVIHPKLTFGESLIYKYASGCTMVLNEALRDLAVKKIPQVMPMHDMWVFGVAMAVGAFVTFDSTPHILYRQHSSNVVGLGQGALYEWKLRAKRFFSQHKDERYAQALALSNSLGEAMPSSNRRLLNRFLAGKKSWTARFAILINANLTCSDKTTQILFWINVIFNKY